MNISAFHIGLTAGGTSQKLAISAVSASATPAAVSATENKGAPIKYLITPDVACFVRKGTGAVTAVADTDQYLAANQTYRVELMDGEVMAFIAAGAGNVYITPRA